MKRKIRIQYSGLVLGIFTWIFLFLYHTTLRFSIHGLYDTYIFSSIRYFYAVLLYWVPIPLLHIFIVILAICVTKFIRGLVLRKINITTSILQAINFAGWLYFLFYFLWGIHYFRPSLSETLKLSQVIQDSVILIQEMQSVTDSVNAVRERISSDTSALNPHRIYKSDAHHIAQIEQKILNSWNIPATQSIRIRKLKPDGFLLRFSTAGFYWPYIGEGHIDGGLHVLQWPFTNAHELAHGYGITDEGECNFIGLMTCIQSHDNFIQYSGWLTYWKYLYFEILKQNIHTGKIIYGALIPGVKNDLKEIRQNNDRYPDILPELRDIVYDTYLKQNNVQAGLQSYNQIIDLKLRYDKTFKH